MLQLHRANGADWSNIHPKKWNRWQKRAAKTHGIVTPSNIISLIGLVLTGYGLFLVTQGSLVPAIGLILIGRLADVLDGWVAERTMTKSPLGEAIDATADKLILAAALLVLFFENILPGFACLVLLIPSAVNIMVALIGKIRKVELHPSKTGKLATGMAWVTILLYVLIQQIENEELQLNIIWLTSFSLSCYTLGAIASSYMYARQLFTKPSHEANV
jgi:phosphatidylglycerophosphate synthase